VILGLSWPAWQLFKEIRNARSEDPLVWEEAISALESETRDMHRPGQAVVFVGSSSIRLWDTLTQDMAPIEVIQHGFGGAKLNDVVHYAKRLVNAYQPRAVVVFAGTNDIHPGAAKSPEQLLASYQAFVATVRADQPEVPIYFIGITPSPLRWSVWPVAQATNALIQQWSESDPNLHFIDTSGGLMGHDGEPDPDNYRIDGLHLSAQGYSVWRDSIRTRLLDDLQWPRSESGTEPSPEQEFATTVITDQLKMPWSFAFMPGGDVLVTERGGTLQRLNPATGQLSPITGVPEVFYEGQGGLLDIALHPDFPQQGWVYLTYSAPLGKGRSTTRLARAVLDGDALRNLEVLYTTDPVQKTKKHYGGRLLFSDEYLYMTMGERGHQELAQRVDNDLGKVLRFYRDGTIPADNPFVGMPGARPAIYTYGHRNPQGLARHPVSGEIWVSEHGPQGGDELNRLVAGANYGWPVITYGEEYGGGKIGVGTAKDGMEQPTYYYVPSIATSGLAFYQGTRFPAWNGSAFIGALRALHLNRLSFDPDGGVTEHRLLADLNLRLRDVKQGPEGDLYLLSEQGSLIRLHPAE
jgi:glucose/arabinose dehydrogenase/lysophospholipase L1-like esterase